jgi:hypothetical protein
MWTNDGQCVKSLKYRFASAHKSYCKTLTVPHLPRQLYCNNRLSAERKHEDSLNDAAEPYLGISIRRSKITKSQPNVHKSVKLAGKGI